MAFARPTLQEIGDRTVADIAARLPGADALPRRSALGVLARTHAGAVHGLYGYIDWAGRQIIPDTAELEQLDRWAGVWGIAREAGAAASGPATFTGTDGALIPAGTLLQRADGVEYATAADATIAGGTASATVAAIDLGAAGNAAAGTALTFVSPVSGVQAAVAVAAGTLQGGADAEDDPTLLARLLARIQQPPHGGASFDWEAWTYDRVAHGVPVSRYWISPQELGVGTMTVRFLVADDAAPGGERVPSADELAAVTEYLDRVRPVTVKEFYVVAPIADPITVRLSALDPNTGTVGAAIAAELTDLFVREGAPGGTVLISHVREAISRAAGEWDHVLVAPVANIVSAQGHIPQFGSLVVS